MVIKFSVREQTISLLPTKSIPRIGSKDYLVLQFVFSNDWDSLSKVVYLQKDSVSEPIELVGDTLKVPEWFTEQDAFDVTLLGVGDTQEVPTNIVSIKLEKSNTLWNEDAPVPQPSWLVTVLEASKRVEEAVVNPPKIGSNGNWFVWDFESNQYVDTGVPASGGGGAVSSVNGQTGTVVLTAEDVGAVSAPATASVGQTIRVKMVDDNGKPTEWEAADSVTQMWEKALEVTLEEAVKEFNVTLNKTYSSFIVFYVVPKNQEDTGENFSFWLTTYKDGFDNLVLDMNWFKPAIKSNMVSIGYAKVERNSNYFVEVENAAFANVSLSEYTFNAHNGAFYKNLVSVQKDTSFNAMRIREQGQFRFPAGSKFVIYGR